MSLYATRIILVVTVNAMQGHLVYGITIIGILTYCNVLYNFNGRLNRTGTRLRFLEIVLLENEKYRKYNHILDSKRSDVCINFTMFYFYFYYLLTF